MKVQGKEKTKAHTIIRRNSGQLSEYSLGIIQVRGVFSL